MPHGSIRYRAMDRDQQSENEPASGGLSVRVVPEIGAFGKTMRTAFSGASRKEAGHPYNPFVSFDFLRILEESG